MEFLLDPNIWIAFAMLTALEIVLGVDNIIFISILVGRLPPEQRDNARRLGLGFALVTRLLLLFSLSWVMGLTADLFTIFGEGISGRDLVLLFGGLFLLYKASHEIFVEVEARDEHGPQVHGVGAEEAAKAAATASRNLFWGIIAQIGVIDIVFSLDSVITAVGMVDQIGVMVAAVITAVVVMLIAAKPIGEFVDRHPSVKVLALAFLVMVGMALTAEAFDLHVPKGYIYAAMAFSLAVEALNLRARGKRLALRAKEAGEASGTPPHGAS
ncbi:TerC family protein [Caldimonas tepidiphila]|uniref:TerC family protein n=1 Tax=Caldimonas tepidiphila TaxID=2315841 RepID=UPI000E5C4416|nr:TerC family protein [Caldimonas tepidiphila]